MLACVLLVFCAAISCHGGGSSVTEIMKDNDVAHSTPFSSGSDGTSTEAKHPKMMLRSPPDEDLLELMVRIAETPEEWERIHTVLKELGIEKRRSQEKQGHQNVSIANNSLPVTTSNSSSSFNSSPSPSSPPSSPSPPSASRLEDNKNNRNSNRSELPDQIDEFAAKNNSTRKAPARNVVGTKFRKKKKGARRKEKEEGRRDGEEKEGGGGGRRRQHHRRRNGVWPKLHRAKKNGVKSRRIETRSTEEEENEKRKTDEREGEGEEMGEKYNWLQLIRLRHDKADEDKRRSDDILADKSEVKKAEDYQEDQEEEEEEVQELEDNHVSWVPSVDSIPMLRGASFEKLAVPEPQHKQIEDNNLPADPSWQQSADLSWKQSADSSSIQMWSEKDKVRPTFAYHRVTASPRERQRAATAYVAVSVVKNNATALEHSHQTHKAAPPAAAPPWSHARHLHRIQEQLKSLSMTKTKLRHHWYEKEESQDPLFDEDKQQDDPIS